MTMMKTTMLKSALTALLVTATAGPAFAQDRWDWSGGRDGGRDYQLEGMGVPRLLPELRETHRGRAFVIRNFDLNGDGRIDPREAREANRAFMEVAGERRDRFDWASRDRGGPDRFEGDRRGPDRVADAAPDGRWDRRAMRDYHFRQTPMGATLTLQEDVLFRTDSAELRPGAIDKLQPLAAYLRGNAGVRVAITGHTDSRGSDAHNQLLSERRASSVRTAFAEMGVIQARFRVEGRGEREPVATNATPAGQRLNRRVEVTLLGQRADSFALAD